MPAIIIFSLFVVGLLYSKNISYFLIIPGNLREDYIGIVQYKFQNSTFNFYTYKYSVKNERALCLSAYCASILSPLLYVIIISNFTNGALHVVSSYEAM